MTEYYADFNFDDPEDSGASEVPQGNTFFGEIQFWAIPIGNPFAKAGTYKPFTLPGVLAYKSTDLKVFNRQRAAKSQHTLFILAGWTKNADGEVYSRDKQYGSWDEDKIWKHLQYPVLNLIPAKSRAALANSGKDGRKLFAKWIETPTEALLPEPQEGWEKDPVTGEDILKYKVYWSEISVFSTKEEMLAAETEFRAQFDNGEVEEKDAWISAELESAVHEATNGDWAGNLEVLKDEAIKVAEKPPAIQAKKLGMSEELAAEVIARATGVPF